MYAKTKSREPNKVEWGASQDLAFQTLKDKLTSAPILHLPNMDKPFILRADASAMRIGAVLLQEHHGEVFPVAYASKKLLQREINYMYSVIERECLAVVWGIRKLQMFVLQTTTLTTSSSTRLAWRNISQCSIRCYRDWEMQTLQRSQISAWWDTRRLNFWVI